VAEESKRDLWPRRPPVEKLWAGDQLQRLEAVLAQATNNVAEAVCPIADLSRPAAGIWPLTSRRRSARRRRFVRSLRRSTDSRRKSPS
jgi:hypothetical protein